jgi:predicted site-specific integrase-resolvase
VQDTIDPFIPFYTLGARFGGKSTRTLYRWVKRGILPEPTNINGRNYIRTSKVVEAERKLDGADVESAT